MFWWISIGALLLLIALWFVSSYLYRKLRLADLEKEQRTPQAGCS